MPYSLPWSVKLGLEEIQAKERLLEGVKKERIKPLSLVFPGQKPPPTVAFPSVWNVPYRYSFFFTGRDQIVEQIFQTFTSSSFGGTPLQALSGLGGMGKTQTAVEYAYRYRQKYNEVDKETDLPSLIIHPVLQEVLRDSMDPQTRRTWAECTVRAVTMAVSRSDNPILQVHLRHATRLLEEV